MKIIISRKTWALVVIIAALIIAIIRLLIISHHSRALNSTPSMVSISDERPKALIVLTNLVPTSTDASLTNSCGIDIQKPANFSPADWARCLNYFNWRKKNNVKINFYGKIVDQHSNAVSGVRIGVRIPFFVESLGYQMQKDEKSESLDSKMLDLISDSKGRFSITDEYGQEVYITAIEKQGYEVSGREPKSFTYGKHYGGLHIPDSDEPVIFQIWERGKTEPLIKNELKFKPKTDHSVYSVNLVSGKVFNGTNQSCDVLVEMWTDNTQNKQPEWSVTFTVLAGGLVVTDDRYLYLAPEGGYQPRWEWSVRNNEPKWVDIVSRKFYVKSRGGKVFASTAVNVYDGVNGEGLVRMSNLVNPNGSRNLEYDPSKEIHGDALKKLIKEFDSEKGQAENSENSTAFPGTEHSAGSQGK